MRATTLVLVLAAGVLAAACSGESRRDPAIVFDTLPGGTVVVRNPAEGMWDSASAWRAVEVARIGSAEGDDPAALFTRVVDLAVDPLGRVWVLEAQAGELRIFEPTGRHVRTVAREGAGPGELRNPLGTTWDAAGRLWVPEQGNSRYSAFDTAGRYLRSYRRASGGYGAIWGGGFDRRGERLYDPTFFFDRERGEGSSAYVRHRLAGDEVVATDSFPLPRFTGESFEVDLPRGGKMFLSIPFSPGLTWRFDGDAGIWSGTGESYRLVHQSLAGDTLRVVERAHAPVPVSAAERMREVEKVRETLRRAGAAPGAVDFGRIPQVKPAFSTFLVDDGGYLWVAVSSPESEPGQGWDVFDPEGRFLGAVHADLGRYPLPRVVGNTLVGVRQDELDVPHVVVYRLEGRPDPRAGRP